MVRTQIQFEKETYVFLQAASKNSGESISSLVRKSVDRHLREIKKATAWERALAAPGRFHSGLKDLSLHHDQYLSDEW